MGRSDSSGGAGALPWLKDPFVKDPGEFWLQEEMTVPLLEQLLCKAHALALIAALSLAVVRLPPYWV